MIDEKIYNTILTYKLIGPDDVVLIGVSGGPDSMCLLDNLKSLQEKLKIKKIVVAHINHMLRKEAEEETLYVKDYCSKNGIECFVKYVDIAKVVKSRGISEETAGREERYKFFEEISKKIKANKIALAHNSNDNAETVLMHLIRGSGLSGLSGIKPYRDTKFIRPLIKCTREEIEEYCKIKKLEPKYDKTNNDNVFTRNKVRNELIPYLKENYNPNIIETLNRLSDVVQEEEDFIETEIEKEYKNILKEENTTKIVIDSKKFNNINIALRKRLIIYIIKKILGNAQNIEKVHIDDIIKLSNNNIGNKYLSPKQNIKIYIKSSSLSFEKVLK